VFFSNKEEMFLGIVKLTDWYSLSEIGRMRYDMKKLSKKLRCIFDENIHV